jgi:predicted transposase/invertase (TIGR01784 family)
MLYGEYDLEVEIRVVREEAHEDGRIEGLEEGKEIGMEKEKLIIAKNLLAKGSTPEFVHRITGLSLEKIKEL